MTQTSQSTRPDVISLADEERANDVVLGAVLGLWDVVNSLTRLQPSRRDRYRVTIFGSARATPGSFGYEKTRRATAMLAAMGCDIVTGGGPGLMQAANEGASTALDYRMLKRDPRWQVYDVIIEGVSLIGSYRVQFNTIIQNSSYEELVNRIKAKQERDANARARDGAVIGSARREDPRADRGARPGSSGPTPASLATTPAAIR